MPLIYFKHDSTYVRDTDNKGKYSVFFVRGKIIFKSLALNRHGFSQYKVISCQDIKCSPRLLNVFVSNHDLYQGMK